MGFLWSHISISESLLVPSLLCFFICFSVCLRCSFRPPAVVDSEKVYHCLNRVKIGCLSGATQLKAMNETTNHIMILRNVIFNEGLFYKWTSRVPDWHVCSIFKPCRISFCSSVTVSLSAPLAPSLRKKLSLEKLFRKKAICLSFCAPSLSLDDLFDCIARLSSSFRQFSQRKPCHNPEFLTRQQLPGRATVDQCWINTRDKLQSCA